MRHILLLRSLWIGSLIVLMAGASKIAMSQNTPADSMEYSLPMASNGPSAKTTLELSPSLRMMTAQPNEAQNSPAH